MSEYIPSFLKTHGTRNEAENYISSVCRIGATKYPKKIDIFNPVIIENEDDFKKCKKYLEDKYNESKKDLIEAKKNGLNNVSISHYLYPHFKNYFDEIYDKKDNARIPENQIFTNRRVDNMNPNASRISGYGGVRTRRRRRSSRSARRRRTRHR
jgi:hypothetical protein